MYRLFLFFFLLSYSFFSCAVTQLSYIPENEKTSYRAYLEQHHITIIEDLSPLPWLVIDVDENTPFIIGRRSFWYNDVKGHFAASIERKTLSPNDPAFSQQWHLSKLGIPELWMSTQGEGITIALIDSGIDPEHPDLKDNILFEQGYDFGNDDTEAYDSNIYANGHGTTMAGLIAAQCDNGQGGCGIAPQVKIIPYKIDKDDSASFSSIPLAAAILAAAGSEAQIISLSLVLNAEAPWVEHAINYARQQGKIVIAAAGNEGKDQVAFPAYLPEVIAVGGVDKENKRLTSSNYHQGLTLVAPAIDLYTTTPGTGYADYIKGTSAATAITSGLTALFWAHSPQAHAGEIIAELLNQTIDIGEAGFDTEYGVGLIHGQAAEKNNFLHISTGKTVYKPKEQLLLTAYITDMQNIEVDLFFRESFPISAQGHYQNLYKVLTAFDSSFPTPFNAKIQRPYLITESMTLQLYGAEDSLLGQVSFSENMVSGVYEILMQLQPVNQSVVNQRKMIWLSPYN